MFERGEQIVEIARRRLRPRLLRQGQTPGFLARGLDRAGDLAIAAVERQDAVSRRHPEDIDEIVRLIGVERRVPPTLRSWPTNTRGVLKSTLGKAPRPLRSRSARGVVTDTGAAAKGRGQGLSQSPAERSSCAFIACISSGSPALRRWPRQSARAADADHPAVVELYQSQGCNSCPPAIANLNALASRPDVLALTFAVDYWDYLGWKDTFAKHKFTERQWQYAHALGHSDVFTPQVVVNGAVDGVGTGSGEIEGLIASAPSAGRAPDAHIVKGTTDASPPLPRRCARPTSGWRSTIPKQSTCPSGAARTRATPSPIAMSCVTWCWPAHGMAAPRPSRCRRPRKVCFVRSWCKPLGTGPILLAIRG